ncbi:MAG: FkbM family methyltransferase [Lachnospiraceae bacterium]|nr:FkbM family methyltransferase [Lachnospiraceae bacterium]
MAEWLQKLIQKLIQKCVPPTRRFVNRRVDELSDEIQIKLRDITNEIRNTSQINKELIGNLTKLIQDNNSIYNSKYNELKKEVIELKKSSEHLLEIQKSIQQFTTMQNKLCELQNSILDLSQEQENQISNLPMSIEAVLKKIEENCLAIEKNNTTSVVNEIKKTSTHYYYTNDYERRVLDSFYELYDDEPKFTETFTNLIRGMEKDSIDKITEIISRQKKIRGTSGKALDIYTQDEQDKISEMIKYVQSHTLQIGKDLYCYEHYLLPVNHIETSVFYYKHGIKELKYLEKIKGKDIVDVGGYIGDSVLILEELSPQTIYTFEASKENFDLLKKTLELNGISNCVAENKALGDKKGTCNLDMKGSQSNLRTIDYVTCEGQEIVEVDTLDDYVSENQLNIGLIKVDIEGAEQMFLHGAKKTICEQKPTLLLSIYHNADDFFGIKPLIESWNLGYSFSIHKPLDISVSREVLLICECN